MIKTMLAGSFSVKVIRGCDVIVDLPRQSNLILSTIMSTVASFGTYLHVGTGSTAPVYADTSLQSFLASQNGTGWTESTSVLNGSTYEKESSQVFTFALGAVVGNLSELGVASQPSTSLQTRALFKDGVGDPTTITVTALDQLVITYFVTKHVSMNTTASSVDLDGDSIAYTIRPCISNTAQGASVSSTPASILTGGSMRMTVNDANRISVAPVTFVPTLIDSGGERSGPSTTDVTLTATGNEVLYTMSMSISEANFQWEAMTISSANSSDLNFILLQIEFDGPNYIVKDNTETVTFKIKEVVDQVIV